MAQTDSCVLAAGRVDNKGTVYSLPTQPRLKAAYMLQANAVLLTKQAFDDHVAAQYCLQCGKYDRQHFKAQHMPVPSMTGGSPIPAYFVYSLLFLDSKLPNTPNNPVAELFIKSLEPKHVKTLKFRLSKAVESAIVELRAREGSSRPKKKPVKLATTEEAATQKRGATEEPALNNYVQFAVGNGIFTGCFQVSKVENVPGAMYPKAVATCLKLSPPKSALPAPIGQWEPLFGVVPPQAAMRMRDSAVKDIGLSKSL
jgi:hypothetical protein